MPGEAAVRIGRRVVELLQKRTADGYVLRVDLRLRPSPEVTPIALPVDAAISHYESSALPWERAAFIRARAAAGDIALGQRFLDAIQPFVWRRSLDFGVIDEIRQISARIRDHYAQGREHRPGLRPQARARRHSRGRVLRADPAADPRRPRSLRCARRRRSTRSRRWPRPGGSTRRSRRELAEAYRLLRTIEHRVQMVDDAQTHLLPPISRRARQCRAAARACERRGADRAASRRTSSASGQIFDSLAPDERRQLSNDPDILARSSRELGFADPARRRGTSRDWRSGKARSLRSPAAQQAFEAMLPGSASGDRRGRRSRPRAQPPERHRRAAVERVNFFRLLEARPPLARAAWPRSSRMRRRSPTSSGGGPSCSTG